MEPALCGRRGGLVRPENGIPGRETPRSCGWGPRTRPVAGYSGHQVVPHLVTPPCHLLRRDPWGFWDDLRYVISCAWSAPCPTSPGRNASIEEDCFVAEESTEPTSSSSSACAAGSC